MPMYHSACPRILSYRPPRIAATLLAVATLLQVALPYQWLELKASPIAGSAAALLGFLLMLRAWWLFRAARTAVCPTGQAKTLITNDVYGLTRNPMYLGIVVMLAGVGLYTGGVMYFVAAASFFAIVDQAFCPYEEDRLRTSFGNEFTRYEHRVRRWF